MSYLDFLKKKIIISESFGFEPTYMPDIAKPHQKDITEWCVLGGRRAIFANFGLGKTFMQLMIAKNAIEHVKKPFLIALPLGVVGEFKRDEKKLNTGCGVQYITDTDSIDDYELKIYVTNYERIRKGDIDASKFSGVSLDEASILRNLKTQTTNYVLDNFKQVPYRFVATATPTPNDYIEILNYAEFLGVADRGNLLTRFFKRNSTKAGDLQLHENKKQEFWQWVATWAVFINKPSDLGYDDTGYDLPELKIIKHEVEVDYNGLSTDRNGTAILYNKVSKDLQSTHKEKTDSVEVRIKKAMEIIGKDNDNYILWHHRETERKALEFQSKGFSYRSVFGSQSNTIKEQNLIDFSNGEFKYLLTKPQIAGSGCNFQEHCHKAIFVGLDFKFNDFIQAVHRIYRYGQTKEVEVHLIYTENEHHVIETLMKKWQKHN